MNDVGWTANTEALVVLCPGAVHLTPAQLFLLLP